MRKPKTQCPADRWEHDARQWKAVASRLAKICSEQIGCSFDDGRRCPEGMQCPTCWLNRAVRETAKEPNHG
jgi:hypothetical protein